MAYSRCASVAIVAMAVVGAATGSGLSVVQEATKHAGPAGVLGLFANNKLSAFSATGKVLGRLSLGTAPQRGLTIAVGNYLGLSNNRRLLFALEPRPASAPPTKPQSVTVVSLARLRAVARLSLPIAC
ncbi:MAG: hypothetical protein H0W90_10570 [Actinobacteria bacterium]|nr:hypothetical protein [Actinomycetota bacterium]